MNRNADFYYVNSELVDLEKPNLFNFSQPVQKISLALRDSLSNFNDTPALGVNKTLELRVVTFSPTNHISNYSEDTPTLNINKTSVISKSANLSCIPNSTKPKNLNKHKKEQRISETENLLAEMISLKSFFRITFTG